MAEPLILVVTLWVDASQVDAYIDYEREAARVMAKHGGQIERVIRLGAAASQLDTPFEIHIVRFPDEEAFQRYQSDPEVQRLSAIRSEVVRRTSVERGRDVQVYQPPASVSEAATRQKAFSEDKGEPAVIDSTAAATRILNLARDEAGRLGHPYIGTEHQLLAVLRLGDPEVEFLLSSAQITPVQVKEALEATLHKGGDANGDVRSELPLTTRAGKVLRFAEEARDLEGSPALRPIHVLRGILKEKLNIAAEVLGQLGVSG